MDVGQEGATQTAWLLASRVECGETELTAADQTLNDKLSGFGASPVRDPHH